MISGYWIFIFSELVEKCVTSAGLYMGLVLQSYTAASFHFHTHKHDDDLHYGSLKPSQHFFSIGTSMGIHCF